MKEKSIHSLELADFDNGKIWIGTEFDVENGIDILVNPLSEYDLNQISDKQIWVRIKCKSNDGTEFKGICNLDIGNSDLINYSFYINGSWINLITKPAPDFVLEMDGPKPFSEKLGKEVKDVFPMTLIAEIKLDKDFKKIIEV